MSWSRTSRPTSARPTRTSPSGPSPSVTTPRGRTASPSPPTRSPSASALARLRGVPVRPGHRVLQALLRRCRGLRGSLHRQGPQVREVGRHHGRRPGHHHQDGQAVPGHGLLGRLHGDGPVPARQRLPSRRTTASSPLANGPYKVESATSPTRSWSWSRTTSGTRTPTRPVTSTPTSASSSSTRTRPRSTRSC